MNGSYGINEGTVEILNRATGEWGSVCDDYFGYEEATVVCRMLGFGSAIRSYSRLECWQAKCFPHNLEDLEIVMNKFVFSSLLPHPPLLFPLPFPSHLPFFLLSPPLPGHTLDHLQVLLPWIMSNVPAMSVNCLTANTWLGAHTTAVTVKTWEWHAQVSLVTWLNVRIWLVRWSNFWGTHNRLHIEGVVL